MKVLILNGSPRKKGNTTHALEAAEKGLKTAGHETEMIHAYALNLKSCVNCDACMKNGGKCVQLDDSAEMMDKVALADMLLIGSPVYWWGISAQAKLFLDKFYSKNELFHTQKKKLGVIATGGEQLSDPQYRLIREQFENICDFLGWDFVLKEFNAAQALGDLAKDTERLAEIEKAAAAL